MTSETKQILASLRLGLQAAGVTKLPVWLEFLLFWFVAGLIDAGMAYWKSAGQEGFTTEGLVGALALAAISSLLSLFRLIQQLPVPTPITIPAEAPAQPAATAEQTKVEYVELTPVPAPTAEPLILPERKQDFGDI